MAVGSTPYLSLFAVGLLLFFITLALNLVSHWIVGKYREAYE
jgi:phosphate transport system permease protein